MLLEGDFQGTWMICGLGLGIPGEPGPWAHTHEYGLLSLFPTSGARSL